MPEHKLCGAGGSGPVSAMKAERRDWSEPAGASRFARTHALRPPWTDNQSVLNRCTSCGDCMRVCPTSILVAGPAATPVVNFAGGECTFCGACAEACSEDVFRSTDTQPWSNIAQISDVCLLSQGVACRTCTDFCDQRALQFDLRARPVGQITLDIASCNGCGACVSACPVGAIDVKPAPKQERQR